jgi:hypothetical protein
VSWIPEDIITLLIERIGADTLKTYRELKMGFVLLLGLAENGRVDAFGKAVDILRALAELKLEFEASLEDKMKTAEGLNGIGEADFPPLLITFVAPQIEALNEFLMFKDAFQRHGFGERLDETHLSVVRELFAAMS